MRRTWPASVWQKGGPSRQDTYGPAQEGLDRQTKGIKINAIGHTGLTTLPSARKGCTEHKALGNAFDRQAAAFTWMLGEGAGGGQNSCGVVVVIKAQDTGFSTRVLQ